MYISCEFLLTIVNELLVYEWSYKYTATVKPQSELLTNQLSKHFSL